MCELARIGCKGEKVMNNVLMLLPVTGRVGGKRKSTVVTITDAMPSRLQIQRRAASCGLGGS